MPTPLASNGWRLLIARCGVAVIAVATLAAASPALGATVLRDDVDSADVSFLAGPGEPNRLVVRAEPDGVRFLDGGAVLSTPSCTLVNAHEVFCPGIAETLIVETKDGDDSIDVSAAPAAFAVGGEGNDVIVAARGSGGPGDDRLRGLGVAGRLHGGAGNDVITAGRGGDEILGGDGDDTIVGGPGRDVISGGEGACATCPLTNDDDVIRGGAGNDVLQVGAGADRLDGESGNDSYVVSASARRVAARVADSGRDAGDSIRVGCAGVRLSASAGSRERSGRYTLPGGFLTFSGIDGALPCTSTARKAVPRVVGMPLASARRVLVAAGFRVGAIRHERSRSVRRGAVISQRPLPAASVPVGTAIALVVSSGPG